MASGGGVADRIELLQAGRAIAALAVLLFHASLYVPASPWLALGAHGVDFFFVLSGFIIHRLYAGRGFDPGLYAFKRLSRVYLPFWPVALVSVGAHAALGYDFDWPASVLLLPGKPALTVAWTLQRELVFYALAAAFYASGRPFCGAALWSGLILLGMQRDLNAVEKVVLDPHNLEFVAGMVIAQARGLPPIRVGKPLLFLGDASYSLYLAHLPAMGLLWRLGADFPTLVLGALAIGIGYHLTIERPLLAWAAGLRRGRPATRRRQAPSALR